MGTILRLADQYSLKVIEDNAQAIGAKYKNRPTGSLSDLACISFYPTKNLGACGDAGMIVTNDDALAERLRRLRAHGMKKRYYHDELGINSRLDEVQAVILLSKLPYLAKWNAERRGVAALYDDLLADCPNVILPKITQADTEHVWHQYSVVVNESAIQASYGSSARDTVMARLSKRGIGSMCYYPVPLHTQSAFAQYGYRAGDFPVAEAVANQILSLPIYPELTEVKIRQVAAALKEAVTESESFTTQQTHTQPVLG